MGIFIFLAIVLTPFLVVFLKKRSQVGKMWTHSVGGKVTIAGKPLHCMHCGHQNFSKREILINTTWVTLFRWQFFNQSARCFICRSCGFLHSFVSTKEKVEFEQVKW